MDLIELEGSKVGATAQLQKHDKERVSLAVPMSALQREKNRIKPTLPKITQPGSGHTKHSKSGKE